MSVSVIGFSSWVNVAIQFYQRHDTVHYITINSIDGVALDGGFLDKNN